MNEKKIYGFDYIKIIAASLIVLHHYQQVFDCKFTGINFYGGRITFGYIVELFFIISGYLTMYSDKRTCVLNGGGYKLLHKILRVYPMACVSILTCIIIKTGISIVASDGHLLELWNLKSIVANFMLVFAGYPYFNMIGINNPLWYVCILIQCYILYYLLECLTNKYHFRKIIIYTTVLLICIVLYRYGMLNSFSFRGITSFSLGILLCIISQKLRTVVSLNDKKKRFIGGLLVLLSLISGILIFLGINQRWVLQFLTFPLLITGISLIDFTGNNLVSNMADISFDVYVWHYPLMALVQLIGVVCNLDFAHSYSTMIAFLIMTWMIAIFVWKFIDLPLRKVVRRFEITYGK